MVHVMSNIELQSEGRRVYIVGNSFPIKDAIKGAGGHWDGDRKAWWIGTGKREEIERAIANAKPKAREGEASGLEVEMKGTVLYKGRAYPFSYFGPTRNGEAAKLHFRDGSKTFWANGADVKLIKMYQRPVSLRRLNEFAKEDKKEDDGPTKTCWECGCAFTYRFAKKNEGDWQDSYCGC